MKSQSAIEYLMTYGWSILIIAVVIASLIELGVFNSANLSPSSCIATTGYSCTNPTLYASGALVTNLGQVGTGPITITGTACTRNNTVTAITAIQSTVLQSEQQQQIVFYCPLANNATGTQFTGHLWIEYSTSSQQNIIEEVGSIIALVANRNVSVFSPIAYVLGGGNMYVINLNSGKVTNTITGFASSMGQAVLSPNGEYAYAASNTGLYTIALSNDIVTNVIGFSDIQGIALSSSGQYAYVPNEYNGNIYVVNLGSDNVVNTITSVYNIFDGGTWPAIALSSNGLYAYVDGGTSSGHIYTASLTQDIAVGSASLGSPFVSPPQSIALSSNGVYAYLTDGNGMFITVNLETESISNTITGLVNPAQIALSPNNLYAYITGNSASGYLYEINLETDQVTEALPLSYPYAIALSASGAYAYVGGNNEVYVINLGSNTISNTITGVSNPSSIAVYNP